MKALKIYFQTITSESAEHGNFADQGLYDEIQVESIQDILDKIDCYLEPSSSMFHSGIWYSSVDPDIDYTTGTETYYTFHLVTTSTDFEKQVYEKLTEKLAG